MKPLPNRRTTLLLSCLGAGILFLLVGAVLLPTWSTGPRNANQAVVSVPLALAKEENPSSTATGAATRSALELKESFDQQPTGGLPAGWTQGSSEGAASFRISPQTALTLPNGLLSSGGSKVTARAWFEQPCSADVQVSAAVYLSSLIPAHVLARGTDLHTTAPSYYAAVVTRGLEVQLVRVVKGTPTALGSIKSASYLSQQWIRLTLRVEGTRISVQLVRLDTAQYLGSDRRWQEMPAWAVSVADPELSRAGQVGLARGAGYAGDLIVDEFSAVPPSQEEVPAAVVVAPAGPPVTSPSGSPPEQGPTRAAQPRGRVPAALPASLPLPRPALPRHHPHIRLALLAYAGNPMGSFEDRLLREHVDLVISNPRYLKHIQSVAPQTPQLIYTNTSNLYLDLLLDWLTYADQKGIAREAAFYHAVRALPFRGDSPSSRPVTRFWSVLRGDRTLHPLTAAADRQAGRIACGATGEAVYLGYPERFREIHFQLLSGAAAGWTALLEYPTAVDESARATSWRPLATVSDTTSGLTHSGQMAFDPPPDWRPAASAGSARLYYVRLRTTAGGKAPVAKAIRGRDYVGASGTTSGTVPAFDAAADANQDGYLNDAEYANRAAGKDARFLYESRMPTANYGQMRFCTNPSHPGFREWAVDHHRRLLERHARAQGLFMDNSEGKIPIKAGDVLEPVTSYAQDYGKMLQDIWQALAPRWVLANTAGGGIRADPVIRQNPAYFEEFAIRPLAHHYVAFEDLAAEVARRAALTSPAPLAILDSHPQKGSPTDPRTQLASLAYYYLLADPETTLLTLFGGYEPGTTWTRHWLEAVAYDIGQPTGTWSHFATGPDPANAALRYRVYQRAYDKALVLYKPLSYVRGAKSPATLASETATEHALDGAYRPLRADGTLGEPITRVSLRNGEGAILVKGLP